MKQDTQQWHKNLTQRNPLKKYSIFSFLGLPKSLNCTRKGLTSHGCSKTRSQREYKQSILTKSMTSYGIITQNMNLTLGNMPSRFPMKNKLNRCITNPTNMHGLNNLSIIINL